MDKMRNAFLVKIEQNKNLFLVGIVTDTRICEQPACQEDWKK
jgi:hypothetical protein